MDKSIIKFRENFANAIDCEGINDINLTTKLENIDGWDSFAIMSIIAMMDEEYGVIINAEVMHNINTLQQLYDLIVHE